MTFRFYWDEKEQKIVKEKLVSNPPKKLSKTGEWAMKNPNGLEGTINDMRAVLK